MAESSKALWDPAAATGESGAARGNLLWIFIVLGAVLVVGAMTATSLGDRIGLKFPTSPAVAANSNETGASIAKATGSASFGIDDLRKVVNVLNEAERARVIGDKAAFAQLVQREAARRSIVSAARKAGLEQRPEVAFLMHRNSEQVLVDTYVQLNTSAALSAEFPNDAQVREFYENNPAQYRLEERIPVWQIFVSAPEGADAAARAEIEKRAKSTAKALKSGKSTFAEAAARSSDHAPSRFNGGFMGNLRIAELIPEVKAVVLAAKPGEIVGPVSSASGFHLLKRGEHIEAETLPLDQVAQQIRATLRRAAENRARQLLVSRAQEQFGVAVSEADLEDWRKALSQGEGAAKP